MTTTGWLVAAIPGFSLAAAALATADRVAGGRLVAPRLLARVAVWGVGLSALCAVLAAAISFGDPEPRIVTLGRWLTTGSLSVDIGFQLDPLSATMAVIIAGLSWLVARFSVNYLHNEPGFGRYFTVLPLFVGAMLILVLAENFLMLFVAWEVVGACSYLLIAFYRDRTSAGEAGTRAFVLNRVGDAGLLAGIFILATHNQGLSYAEVLGSPLSQATATAVGLCFLLGAAGKSAQMPLGGWLARAMEGPTPSSALIHGATMVTAGVYLVVRSAPIYERAPIALVAVGAIGALTALYGQLAGLTQTDIKGMLAASTNAHLGFMLLLCGLGLYPIAIFHLVAHAFYKTNLFLTAPSILHHLHGGPDPTAVARPADTARATSILVGAAALVLVALPFATGIFPLPGEWARGTVALGGLGAVAAFGLWFSAGRIVRATFHDDTNKTQRRTAVAIVVGFALVAVAIALRLVPGGIDGSWFARLLAPTVSETEAAIEASPVATIVLITILVGLMVSGLAVPRFFDRFRAEQPPGTSGSFARRLYFAAANRVWLDEAADRATATLTRAGTAVDRFERAVLDPMTGALLPSYHPKPQVTWEARLVAAAEGHDTGAGEPTGRPRLDWLPPIAHPTSGPEVRKLRAEERPLERLSSLTTRLERRLTSQAGGLYGALTNTMSGFSQRTERAVFQRGVESLFERVSRVLALFTEAVEDRIFQLGPGRVAQAGERVRRALLGMEAFLGRPTVAALVAFACIVAVAAAR
ncbi:MAG TPA: proton-conducting transporter membrane subunit [Actinomycetota bacterium]|nr:proton-conducting transporter membrane subunit [Actinomycetota bacterium]